MKINKIYRIAALITGCIAFNIASAAEVPDIKGVGEGHLAEYSISAKTVAAAIKSLGYTAQEHKDAKGNPHFVFNEKIDGAKSVSIFMLDCGTAGCEDAVLYADFGPVKKLSAATMNEWNHIGSMLRSRVARSGDIDKKDGEIGLSMPISFLSNAEQHKFAMLTGLFLVEVKMFSATIANQK